MTKAIMVQGTTSNAGKSLLTAALCRIFAQDGYSVAPFKSQNMALNSFITCDGSEMGRAQVMQAEAAGVEPDVRMNPVLLKPTGDTGSQVIVMGEVVGNMTAVEYYAYKNDLVSCIRQAYDSLATDHDIMVIEGAGSPAEINLREGDIVNMGMARMAHAPVVICGDIDRGGVFASLYGTVALLAEDERPYVKGTIINKFRGDVEILRPGLSQLEDLTGVPVLGVVPMLGVDVDDEDSLASRLSDGGGIAALDIAVIRLPRISNFTDFNALERFEQVSVRYVRDAAALGDPDLIIIPGTKNTMDDLLWMRQNGLEASVLHRAEAGTPIIGICGGYQMLGRQLDDPFGVEHGGVMRGMGLLSVSTVFGQAKTRTRVTGCVKVQDGFFAGLTGAVFEGYEIHMGETAAGGFSTLSRTDVSGMCSDDGSVEGAVLGSYVHGLFDEGDFARRLVELLLARKGIDMDDAPTTSYDVYKQQQYDLLADGVRKSLDMEAIYRILEAGI